MGLASVGPLHPLTSDVTPLLLADRKPGQGLGQLSGAACRLAHHFEWRLGTPLPMETGCPAVGPLSGTAPSRQGVGRRGPPSGGAARSRASAEVLRRDLV